MTQRSNATTEAAADHGVYIRASAREAKRLSAIVSPTRDFVATERPGVFFMETRDEVQALHDADFLTASGVRVQSILNRPAGGPTCQVG